MIEIDSNRHGFRFHRPRWVILALLTLVAGPAMARSVGYPPEGLPVGRLILAPYFVSQVGVEDNLFRLSSCPVDEPDCFEPQMVSRNMLGLAARLPVRNSLIELRYEAAKRQYERAAPPRRALEEIADALFQLNFSSGDQLSIRDTYTRGSSDVRAIDEGGEFEFQDRPFDLNRFEAMWTRTIPSRQGFIVRFARVDLNFATPEDGDTPIPFFDYRGFESNFEYRQPLAGRKWLRVYYDSRRFNHYDPNDRDATGVPYRKEVADTLQLGLGGMAGRNKPFNLRIGYGRFRLEGTGAEFNGIVGAADLAIGIGARTNLTFNVWRRPLPSNFPTYYIVNSFRVAVERPFLRKFVAGAGLAHLRSQYGDPLEYPDGTVEDEIRKDQRYVLEAYLDWFVHPRVAIRIAAGHQQRISSSDGSAFEANAASVGLRLGWF